MKKALIALAVVAVCLSAARSASAEDLPPMYASFLGLAQSDFQYLYPGSNYQANPAFVRQLKRPFIVFNSNGSWEWESYQEQHGVGYSGSGSSSGTDSYNGQDGDMPFRIDAFFPVGTGMTLGASVGGEFEPYSDSYTYTGWTSTTQSSTETESSLRWSLYGDALFAMTIGDSLDIGIYPGYYGSSDPYSVGWTTDPNVASGKAYVASPSSSYTSTTGSMPSLAAGAVLRLGSVDLGLGLVSSYAMNSNSQFVAVDEDGDGYADTIVPLSDYYTTSSSWGAFGGPYTGFSYFDVDDTLVIAANPTLEWKLTDWISIIGGGSVGFTMERKVNYLRLSSTDQSGTQIDLQTPSAALFGGVSVRPVKEITLRAEIGFTGSWLSQQNNSVGMTGSSIFSSGNSGHYHEVSWASQPNSGAVSSVVSRATNSYSLSTLTYEALFGVDWTPAPNVVIFSVGSLGYTTSSTLYSVYDTVTGAVWQESSGDSNLALTYSLNLGTGVFVTKDVFVGVQAQTGNLNTDKSSESTPTSNGATSTGGSGTYSDLYNYNIGGSLSVMLFCVVSL